MNNLMRRASASILTASLLVSIPGPGCYQALANTRTGAVPGGPGAGVGAAAAGAPVLPTIIPGLTGTTLPPLLDSGSPAAMSDAASAVALPGAAAAVPSAAAVPAAVPAAGAERAEAAPGVLATAEAIAETGGSEQASDRASGESNAGTAGRAFDGGMPNVSGGDVPVFAGGPGGPRGPNNLRPTAQSPDGPYHGGPEGPTQPYTLGRIGMARHAAARWLIRKLDLEEGLFKFTEWFGDWAKWVAIWPLYSHVLHMRLYNMFTTRHLTVEAPPPAWDNKKHDRQMTADGAWTDRKDGNIGRAGTAMDHNMPLELIQPKPVDTPLLEVTNEFMPRRTFRFVPLVNSHFAAEIQSQIEGWFGSLFTREKPMQIKVPKTYPWPSPVMEVARTQEAPNKKPDVAMPVYNNVEASAWHLNQTYGSTEEQARKLRTKGGKGSDLLIGEDGLLPLDPAYPAENGGGVDLTGSPRNIWAVRSMRHLAFALEHNDIVKEYRAYLENGPSEDRDPFAWMDHGYRQRLWETEKAQFDAMSEEEQDEWLYWRARTINSGANAGDHTHDWTKMLLYKGVTHLGMEIDYWGLLGRRFKKWWYPKMWMHRWFGWLLKNDILSGLPGSKVQRWSAPYSLGQSFLKVYRMRELMRDIYRIYSMKSGEKRADVPLAEMQGVHTRRPLAAHSQEDWLYSAGLQFPGDILLNNVTEQMRHLKTMDGREVDMTLMDLLRDDERGFPRYNEYRRALHLPAPRSMLELTGGDWDLAQRLDKAYRKYIKDMWAIKNGRPASEAPEPTDLEVVESVHAHVGLRASPRMPGMVLSVDAYIIFTLNAPDRFAANRFLSEQFDFETYGEVGINRVLRFDFKTLLLRHWPQLDLALDGKASGYMPFNRLHPQLDPAVDAEEKAMGIVTHSLDSLAAMGPRAAAALHSNSPAAVPPAGVAHRRRVLPQSGTRLGRWLGGWIPGTRDEVRQVGPKTFLGRRYLEVAGRRFHLLDLGLSSEEEPRPEPNYQELSDQVERSALKLIKKAFLVSLGTAGVLALGAGFSWLPALLIGASLALQLAALLAHNAGRGSWKRTLAETGMGELGALNGLRYLNNRAARPDRRGGKLSLLATLAALAAGWLAISAAFPGIVALHAAAAALGVGVLLLLGAYYLMLGKDLERLRVSLYSILKQGRPRLEAEHLPGDSHLEKAIRFFSEGNPVGKFGTIRRQVKALGLPGLMTALSSVLWFSGKTQRGLPPGERDRLGRFDIYMPNIANARHPAHSGVYGPDGNVDMGQFERVFAEFAGGRDQITAKEIARMRAANRRRARAEGASWLESWFSWFASKRQFDQLMAIAPDRLVWEDGKLVPAVSRAQLLYWYQGGLRYDLAQEREGA